jgi:hypothetical protein
VGRGSAVGVRATYKRRLRVHDGHVEVCVWEPDGGERALLVLGRVVADGAVSAASQDAVGRPAARSRVISQTGTDVVAQGLNCVFTAGRETPARSPVTFSRVSCSNEQNWLTVKRQCHFRCI